MILMCNFTVNTVKAVEPHLQAKYVVFVLVVEPTGALGLKKEITGALVNRRLVQL